MFISHIKYPKTYHLPWSESISKDDRVLKDLSSFKDKEIVVSIKMDGENTSLYTDKTHARSIDSQNHPSRNWVKSFWSQFSGDIPIGWRICGENLFAKHSIKYKNLDSYFYGFSIWDHSTCLFWSETKEYFKLLGITPVPVIYEGIFNEKKLKEIASSLNLEENEGYVIRTRDSFDYKNFKFNVAKFVRKEHVLTHRHWMRNRIEKNELKK